MTIWYKKNYYLPTEPKYKEKCSNKQMLTKCRIIAETSRSKHPSMSGLELVFPKYVSYLQTPFAGDRAYFIT